MFFQNKVEYLFSDKTGTLTENIMVFKKCSIDGVLFKDQDGILLCENEDYNERSVRKFLEVLSLCHTVQVAPKIPTNSTKNVTLGTKFYYQFTNLNQHSIENINLDVDDPFDLVYNASSPDEKAIVEACRQYGVAYLGESEVRI